jgi:hypothetical protein
MSRGTRDRVLDASLRLFASRGVEGMASVIMSALVGFHLANQFFRGVPSRVDRARFVSALVDVVSPPPG